MSRAEITTAKIDRLLLSLQLILAVVVITSVLLWPTSPTPTDDGKSGEKSLVVASSMAEKSIR
ncbi:MAG: hypothetical protein ABW049_08600 [Spongiibacteraceae bacterium]